jgi:hypothetical protein
MGRKEETHLAEELVVVREYSVDELESKRLVEIDLLWTLSVAQQQTKVLEDGRRVAGGRVEACVVPHGISEVLSIQRRVH